MSAPLPDGRGAVTFLLLSGGAFVRGFTAASAGVVRTRVAAPGRCT